MSKNDIDLDLLAELDYASDNVRSFEYGNLLLCKAIEDVRDILEDVEDATQDLADPEVLLRIQAIGEQLQLIDQTDDYEEPRYEDDKFQEESGELDVAWSFEEMSDAFEELKQDLDELIPEITQALEDHLARLQDAETADEQQRRAFETQADRFSKAAWDAYDYLTRAKFLESSD